MRFIPQHRPSPAMGVAVAAMIFAMSGAGAAATGLLPDPLTPQPSGARAYASIDAQGRLVAGRYRNVVAVTQPDIGVFCVTLAASVAVASAAPLATLDESSTFGDAAVVYAEPQTPDCPDSVEVTTRIAVTSTQGQFAAYKAAPLPFSIAVP